VVVELVGDPGQPPEVTWTVPVGTGIIVTVGETANAAVTVTPRVTVPPSNSPVGADWHVVPEYHAHIWTTSVLVPTRSPEAVLHVVAVRPLQPTEVEDVTEEMVRDVLELLVDQEVVIVVLAGRLVDVVVLSG
jgi:hypothetical protein